ncbi:MAG: 7TM-DISM domain-containing protein [Bacteroidota bacterium]
MKALVTAFLLFSNIAFVLAQGVVVVRSEEDLIQVNDKVATLEDTSGNLAIEDVVKAENQQRFKTHDESIVSIPLSSSVFWVKITVSNHSS